MNIWKRATKELKRNLTVMLIPHSSTRPVKINFSLTFLLFLIASWTCLTLWAGYLSSCHIDYWKIQADHKLMQLKVAFFAEEVKKSQEMLEQVKENDMQVRALLEMKSKKAIVENEGKGGPSTGDTLDLNRMLEGKIYEMSEADIQRQTAALQEATRKRIESHAEIFTEVEKDRAVFRATPNIWPCIGHITSTFGFRTHPIFGDNELHTGLDIANEKNTSIYTTADGTVRLCDWQPGYGRLIIIDHGYGLRTYYGHLCKILVKPGDRVKRGSLIGLMGSTGTSTGNHLHYEVQHDGNAVNPVRYLHKLPAQLAGTRKLLSR